MDQPPPGSSWRWEDYDTGESGVMPWSQERDPTDYEIDSYRAREKYRAEDTWKKWALSKVPDPVEDFWNARNKPHSTAPSELVDRAYKASGGAPLSMPFMGYNVPIPESVGKFAGQMFDEQTSDLNIALNALTLGGYAGLGAGNSAVRAGLTGLGRLGSRAQMGAGAIGVGGGAINAADALSKGEDATWGDYGNAALQMGLGAFNIWGGKGDLAAMSAPRPDAPGPITDPARLLGPGTIEPPPTPGARFYGGPEGVQDLYQSPTRQTELTPRADVLSQQAAMASTRPPGEQFSGGIQDLSDPYIGPNGPAGAGPAGGIEIAGLGEVTPPDLPLQPPVSPRGPSAGRPFEQDPGIWQRMQQGPGGEPVDLSSHVMQDPIIPNTVLDGPGTSRPASDFWRTIVAEGAPPPTPRAVSALGAVEPPNIPDAAPIIDPAVAGRNAERAQGLRDTHPFIYDLEDWKAEQLEMGSSADEIDEAIRQSTEKGIDPTKSDDLYDLENYMGSLDEAPEPDWIDEQTTLGHYGKPELIEWNKQQYGGVSPAQDATIAAMAQEAAPAGPPPKVTQPPAPRTAAEARAYAQSMTPTPVAPVRDAASRVAVMPEPTPAPTQPLVRPPKLKGPTPDRVIRIGRGVQDSVRAIFPDKLHVDLFSALGRAKRQMRGEKGGISPNYEGLAQQLGVSLKEAHRIADEYRLKVLQITKAAPGLGPEGSDVIDIEMPHWGGKPAEMVKQAPPPVVNPERAAREANIEAAKAEIAKQDAAEARQRAMTNTPEQEAAMAARHKATQDAYARAEAEEAATKLNEALAARGASPESKTKTPQSKLPKSKNARVALVMDELATLGTAEVQAITNDPARLLATAKAAGIKSGTLKSAIQEWFKKAGGSETGALRLTKSKSKYKDLTPDVHKRYHVFDEHDNLIEKTYDYQEAHTWADQNDGYVKDVGETPELENLRSKTQDFFKKVGGSEKGALSLPSKAQLKTGFEKSFDAANQVRMTSMLSGLALPKSLAGNLGAHLAAALEGRTLKPLKVLLNVKSIARDVSIGWKGHANPALIQGLGRFNYPGRAMGAFDFASIESLQRAGLSEKAAKELLLTGSNPVSAWKPLDTRLGKLMVPFRTTPFNQFAQGITRWKKHPEVAAAAMILGYMGGKTTKEPEEIAMMSALAGPYALPFLLGASWTAGAEVLGGISPIPEWGITKTLTNPFGAFTESPGKRWFRPGGGFGEAAKKEKQHESLLRRRAKRKAQREASQ